MPLLNSGQYALKWANGAKWVDLVDMIRAELLAELPNMRFVAPSDSFDDGQPHPWNTFCHERCVVVEDEPEAEALPKGKKLGTPGE